MHLKRQQQYWAKCDLFKGYFSPALNPVHQEEEGRTRLLHINGLAGTLVPHDTYSTLGLEVHPRCW